MVEFECVYNRSIICKNEKILNLCMVKRALGKISEYECKNKFFCKYCEEAPIGKWSAVANECRGIACPVALEYDP